MKLQTFIWKDQEWVKFWASREKTRKGQKWLVLQTSRQGDQDQKDKISIKAAHRARDSVIMQA